MPKRPAKNIIDLSKAEAGTLGPEFVTFRLEDVVSRVSDLFMAATLDKNLELNITMAPGLPTEVRGDPNRVEQVLANLAGSALKFPERGSVSILVKQGDSRPDCIAFEVRDTGSGNNTGHIGLIFEPFCSGGFDNSESIVRSTPAGDLPTEKDFTLERFAKLLIAEDVEDNRCVLKSYLKGLPFELDFAEDGAIALRKAFDQSYDLILMDMQMPDLDGFTIVRHIRAYETSRGKNPVPIIALTAFAFSEGTDRCLEAGCSDYLARPVKKSDLLSALGRHLTQPALKTTPRRREIDGISPEIRELIPEYLDTCTLRADDMAAWIEAGDFDAIRRLGHSLKGSGGMLGLQKITEIGARIQDMGKAKNSDALRKQLAALRNAIADGRSQFTAKAAKADLRMNQPY